MSGVTPSPASTPTPADPPWRAQELLLLSEVMRLVGQSLAPEVVLREMLHLLSELLGLNRGRIVLVDEGGAGASSIRFCYGLTRAERECGRYNAGEGITGAVLATGQPMIVQDIDAEPRFLARAVARDRLPRCCSTCATSTNGSATALRPTAAISRRARAASPARSGLSGTAS